MKDLSTRAIHAARWATIEGIASQGFSFAAFLMMARLLSPGDFGLVAMANIYVLVTQVIIFQGLGQAIIQKLDLQPEHLDAAFWINVCIGILLVVLTMALSQPVAAWFHAPRLCGLLQWLSILFITSALTDVQVNLLARNFAYRSLALRTLLVVVLSGSVGVVMAWKGYGVWSLVGQQLAGGVISVLTLWSVSAWRPRGRFSMSHGHEMLRFGSKLFVHEMISLVNKRSDQFFVGKYLGTQAIGIYAIAARVSTLVNEIAVKSLSRVSLSSLARLQTNEVRIQSAFGRIFQLQISLILPLAVGLSIFSRQIVLATIGRHWIAAVPAMQTLLLAIPFEASSSLNYSMIIARAKPGWVSTLSCIHAGANLTLFLIVAKWGVFAVALAYTARAMILYPVEMALLSRLTTLSLNRLWQLAIPALCAVVVMCGFDYIALHICPADWPPFVSRCTGHPGELRELLRNYRSS